MECLLYNSLGISSNDHLVLGSLKSSFELDHPTDINLNLTEAMTLHPSKN